MTNDDLQQKKQDVLDEITDLLGLPRRKVSRGSSLPSDVFQVAADRVGAAGRSMPARTESIITKAGLAYHSHFDSRNTASGGGSTVTLEGAQALRDALKILLA
ncbi:hypothetical protein P9139_11805 [Curtobacterium flaccumfaciens]|nr:hypothetical protein P9139_11805 [Curtobacterium flaccumfaciens]